MFRHLKKIENLIVMLVVISAIAVVMYQTTPREYTIRPSAGWKTFTTNDQKEGGSSTAIDESTDSEFAYRYEIRQGSVNPYASLIILSLIHI